MTLSRNKLALYGFLTGAAALGLLIDRLYARPEVQPLLAVPSPTAQMGVSPADESPPDIGPPLADIFRSSSRPTDSMPARSVRPTTRPSRDAFSLTPAMRGIYKSRTDMVRQEQQKKEKESQDRKRLIAETFIKAHPLKGLILKFSDPRAIVGDRILRVGDRLDGFVLRHIGDYRARFESDEVVVELTIPKPLGPQAAPSAVR